MYLICISSHLCHDYFYIMSVIIIIFMYMIAILIIFNTANYTIMMIEEVSLRIKEIEEAASERILIMTKQWGANVHFMRLWIKYLDVLEVREIENGMRYIEWHFVLSFFLPYYPSHLLTYLFTYLLTSSLLTYSSSFISITLLTKPLLPLSTY